MSNNQKTIKNNIKFQGKGLHSGKNIKVELLPAPPNTGIIFKRTDISPSIEIPANYINVQNTMLATSIVKNGVEVKTIEHFFAALFAFNINNLYININGPEMPILDGSAEPFIHILKIAGVKDLKTKKNKIKVLKKIIVEENDKWASFEPYNGFEIEFEINYNSSFINKTPQKAIYNEQKNCFISDFSMARTFGFFNEIENLKKQNFILGGDLKNAILVNEDKIENEEGLRIEDEFVKHKILDVIGDLYLLNYKIEGRYKGFKSGHSLNNKLLRKLMEDKENFSFV